MNGMKLEQVTVVGEELAVRLADSEEMYVPLSYLRENCPCAACEKGRDAEAIGMKAAAHPVAQLVAIDVVGGYAVRLVWADGHGSGIYSFDFLRRLDDSYRESAF
jgi:DUF971 family protein